jgi:hypothetical protein
LIQWDDTTAQRKDGINLPLQFGIFDSQVYEYTAGFFINNEVSIPKRLLVTPTCALNAKGKKLLALSFLAVASLEVSY